MTDYILYVISDRQVSEKKPIYVFECMAIVTPPGPHHPNWFLLRAGLEPGIPVQEAGALTRNAKGYSR